MERERGLYKNGRLWWIRVKGTPRSTGTADLAQANARARAIRDMQGVPAVEHWLDAIVDGDVSIEQVYLARAAGRLHLLADEVKAKAAAVADTDLRPWVTRWVN